MNKKIKICLACSVGGHLTQMTQLSKLYKKHNYFFITEDTELTRDIKKTEKAYLIKLINRKKWNFIFLLIYNTIYSLMIFLKEKPDMVISTGALSAVPFCVIAKITGKKFIFIESFAKMDTPTLSGRILYNFADMFIVQWEKLLAFYPKALYGGSIY